MNMANKAKGNLLPLLMKVTGGPLTLGKLLEAIRLSEEISQSVFAKKLSISRSHLNDIEKGRKWVSPERAERFAKALKYSSVRFVSLSLQEILDKNKLRYEIELKVA